MWGFYFREFCERTQNREIKKSRKSPFATGLCSMNVKITKLNLCVFGKTSEITKISSHGNIDLYSILQIFCMLIFKYEACIWFALIYMVTTKSQWRHVHHHLGEDVRCTDQNIDVIISVFYSVKFTLLVKWPTCEHS